MAFPLTMQSFIMKPLYGSQPKWPRDSGNVFPFLVTLQHFNRNGVRKLFVDAMAFFDFPHVALCIY